MASSGLTAIPTIHLDGPCPVCHGRLTAAAADFPLGAPYSGQYSTLFHCISCGSAHFRHEPADSSSVSWHKKVMSRNLDWSSHLERALLSQCNFSSVIDIGCGIGTWMHYLDRKGYRVFGFEPGHKAAAFGSSSFSLNICAGYFTEAKASELCGKFDLVTCIMVLEHLRDPRALISEISNYCIKADAMAFVSVPFYYGSTHLGAVSSSKAVNVFNSTSAHVTYFSETGMKLAFSEHGLISSSHKKITPRSRNWSGFVFKPG